MGLHMYMFRAYYGHRQVHRSFTVTLLSICCTFLHWPIFTHWDCFVQVCCLCNALILWNVLNNKIKIFKYCTMLGFLARFCPIIVQVTPLKTPSGLVTPFITIPITRSCNHTQLLLTPLHNYNSCAFVPTITYCTVTLLTINSLCWLSTLRFFAVFAGWLTDSLSSPAGSLTLCRLSLSLCEIPVLRWACADGIVNTMPHGSFLHCDGLVTGETSVVYSQCIAVGLFLE
jgi:hypothetical protein